MARLMATKVVRTAVMKAKTTAMETRMVAVERDADG